MNTKDTIFRSGLDVAVIGMAGRFPGARNTDEFFNNLKNGVESITFLTRQELEELGVPAELINDAGFVNAKAGLENVSYFDASFFGYTAGEAAIMDPQMRLFHECAWEAMENAGTNPELYQGSIGVYAGGTPSAFWEALTLFGETGGLSDSIINGAITETFGKTLFNDKDLMSTWISYKFDLRGPSNTMFSSCSTSLVVIHTACQAILSGECDMALAGGVSVMTPERNGYLYQEGLIVSADGHCRAFDADASGTVFGDGVGIVVLKLLEKALEDNDTIYAVVKSTAVNNDGGRKVGFTAPSVEGQEEVIRMAHQLAEIKPQQVGYVEAHGTGTIIGDPIEFEALRRAFGPVKKLSCAIGSVKTNVGHLNSAAGVCGFIKTVLTLYHRYLFPSLNFKKPNPNIDLENSPFYINTELKKWENPQEPLIAGVSSFGVGGTNAHVILCEAPYKKPDDSLLTSRGYQLILFSAKSKTALQKMCTNLALHLKNNPLINLADVSYTLQVGRKTFPHRKMILASDINNTAEILSSTVSENLHTVMTVKNGKPLVYMFPGQGAQYFNMGLGLYETEPLFREQIDRCFKILNSIMGNDIKEVLYSSENKSEQNAECTDKINQTEFAQPLLFIFEYALAKLLISWGIMPYAMIGHSIGEYVAACLAGVFSLEDALTIVAFRGKLMQQLPGGSMVSISLPEKHLVPLLTEKISLAAINSPESCVVSGANEDMDVLVSRLEEEGQTYRRLHTSHAFHSPMMEPILNEFTKKIERLKLNKPSIPFISNLSGLPITIEESTDPRYWARHLRETVRFSAGLQTLLEQGCFFVEIGPGKTLTSFVNQHKKNNNDKLVVNLVRHPKEDVSDDYYLLSKIGELWLYGVTIDWRQFYPGERRTRIPLPTYPFEGKKFWYDLKKWGKETSIQVKIEVAERLDSMNDKSELNTGYSLPANKIEQKLVESWQKFFGINGISIDDDFFELGGDSLKSSIIISRIHKEFNVKIPIAEFFKRPTIRGLALFIADNSREDIHFSIEPVEKKEYYELSSAQKRLYILNEMDKKSIGYNETSILNLEGNIEYSQFEDTFKRLMKRHESLRTFFEMTDEGPVQRIRREVKPDIKYYELETNAHLDKNKIDDIIKNFICPFDLSHAPLLRLGLVKKTDYHFILVVDMHHIISDGTSMEVLVRESMAFYKGEELPELRIQYKDFSEWQNSEKVRKLIKKQEEYWLRQFEGEIPLLNLPLDYPRPLVQSFEGKTVSFELEATDIQSLKKYVYQEGVTLYILLLAITNILLAKISSQEDIIIGTPIAGRRHTDLGKIIGMFVNTLAMRNYPVGGKTFRTFLGEVKERALEAFELQEYQFEALVENVAVNRDVRRNPLFDVMLLLQNMLEASDEIFIKEIEGLKIKSYGFEKNRSLFDLSLEAFENKGNLYFKFEYCTKLFREETILRFVKYFKTIMSKVIDAPERKLSDIEILSKEEVIQLLYEFNDTAADYPKDKMIHQLFEEQSMKTHDSVAVVFEDQSLSYMCLNEKAGQLASYLNSKINIQPGEPVAILMDRSINIITAILGVLKAGGAYVPIDASLPEFRVKHMINDAGIGIVISGRNQIKILNRLQWECKNFHTFLCMDSASVYEEEEVEKNELMDEEMWKYIGESAEDEIAGGGWISSFTGEPFSKEEMREYSDNTFKKLNPLLRKDMRVLEIGCASSSTMFRIAPYVGFYYGTDLSEVIIEKARKRVKMEGHKNISLDCLPAHDINKINEMNFDLIIINSVIQFFHGHNYLREVIVKAINKLKQKGYLFLGDIMDQEQKKNFIRETRKFKQANNDKNYRTKTDWGAELFVTHGFFEDFALQVPVIQNIEFSDKIHTIENELTKFRYDALVTVDKSKCKHNKNKVAVLRKHQHDLMTLNAFNAKGGIYQKKQKTQLKGTAYIIYTSGSTGLPKGIMIEHQSLINFIKGITDVIDFRENDHILSLTTISFDIFVLETLLPLTRGSEVVIGNLEEQVDPSAMLRVLSKKKISILQLTPSRLQVLLSGDIDRALFRDLKYLIIGGEAFPGKLLNEIRKFMPGEIYNVYGPTETTIWSTIKNVTGVRELNIGRPIANTQIYILNKNKKLVPVNVAGELCIGGHGLARGYLNNPELTEKQFKSKNEKLKSKNESGALRAEYIQHSAFNILHSKLYYTGDRALWLPDGNIEFLGRIDQQVKLRGFRIELGEIENLLLTHEQIKDTAVVLKGDEMADKFLTAYFVSDIRLSDTDLKEYLSKDLPDYMIPVYFVQLEKLPLTPSGKVDRKALPDPGLKTSKSYTEPRNAIEKKLIELWSEILAGDELYTSQLQASIGIDDNFFHLGGHSLKATILVSKIHKTFHVNIPLADIFKTPTVRGLANYIKAAGKDKHISIESIEKKKYYALSSVQKRLYLLNQMEPQGVGYNIPFFSVLEGEIDKNRFEYTFKLLIERHESLRTSFHIINGEPVQKIHDEVEFEIEYKNPSIDYTDYTDKKDDYVHHFIQPFNLSKAPLLRVGLLKEKEEKEDRHILIVDMHHIISDGVSMNILVKDFMALYEGRELPPLKLQYKDFSEWQWKNFHTDHLKKQAEYWLNRFKGDIPILDISTDYPRPPVQLFEGCTINSGIEKILTAKLKALASAQGITLYMLLLTIYTILLSKYTNQNDIIVGTPVAGRRHTDLEPIVGMFANVLLMRNLITPQKKFEEFLEDVKYNTLQAFENQDYSIDYLAGQLNLKRDASRNPLYEVIFAMETQTKHEFSIPGLELKTFQYSEETIKTDLRLGVAEIDEKLIARLTYSTVLFKRKTADDMLRHYVEIIEQVIANKMIKIEDIKISHHLKTLNSKAFRGDQNEFNF